MIGEKKFLKFLFLIVTVKYPKIRRDYKYFIRDNYFSRLRQVRFFFRDYIKKDKYKCIEYRGEFQQELTFVLPFAYWHHLNGTLKSTVSSKGTRDLYFFSASHLEKFEERDWTANNSNFEIPNINHSLTFSYKKWARVPLKEKFRNEIFKFDKPILIIANKYNIEWDGPPLNFIDVPTLETIISKYKDKYQIIYNRPLSTQIISDNSEILDFDEYKWLEERYPEVLLMTNLYQKYKKKLNSFNHLQLLVYANCSHFVSVHGGTAALASYFEGVNIIYSKRGIEHELNEFNTIFHELSNAKILHAKTSAEIFDIMQAHF